MGRNAQWLTRGNGLILVGVIRVESIFAIRVAQLWQVQLFDQRRSQDIL